MRNYMIAACLAAMWAVAAWADAETFPLEYKPLYEKSMPFSRVRLQAQSAKPDGVAAEPDYIAEPLYAGFQFGADGEKNPFLLVVDKSAQDAEMYDMLYVDLDRDGDLREEKPIRIKGGGEFELTIATGGKPHKRRFTASFSRKLSNKVGATAPVVTISNNETWTGKFSLNGEEMVILLRDVNCNGIYNEPFGPGDDGRAVGQAGDTYYSKPWKKGARIDFALASRRFCPAIIEAGGKLYDAVVAADGSSISFEPEKGPFGAIETTTDCMTLAMVTADGRSLAITTTNGKIPAPVGKVRLWRYTVSKTDADGVDWVLFGWGGPKLQVAVEEGKVSRLTASPPIRSRVFCDRSGKIPAGSVIQVSPAVSDAAGWGIRLMKLDRENPRPSNVSVLVEHDGKVIAAIECKRTRGGYASCTVSVPDNLRGKLTLTPKLPPTGPFELKVEPLVLEIVDP